MSASEKIKKAGNLVEWHSLADNPAPQGTPVWTKIDNEEGVRNLEELTLRGRMWWAGDMYVYYTPTHWAKPIEF